LDADQGLSTWEVGFIESLEDQVDDGFDPTESQLIKLREIWDKVCG